MNILLIGSGGREHALAWKIAASPLLTKLWCAPGNAGIAQEAECVALDVADHSAVIDFCKTNKVDLVVVGPEAPLAAGIVDDLAKANIKAFGPSKAASQLESSKGFTKDICKTNDIPTAAYERFRDGAAAKAYVRKNGAPIVVKADGLAAGKGVVVAMTLAEAEAAIDALFTSKGAEAVIEEFMEGEEASFFVLCDGENALPLAAAQDHKRAFDGDKGPNTGGMGAYSPAPVVTPQVHARVMREIIQPAIAGMAAEGHPYTGFLYAGLMIAPDGGVLTLEFNCRLGDPETQPILMRLRSDLVDLLESAIGGRLDRAEARWDRRTALGVVVASHGYPDAPRRGDPIEALPSDGDDCMVFHAGTRRDGQRLLTDGGRVLCVTALGENVRLARRRAYDAVAQVRFAGAQHRTDIGARALAAGKGK